MARKSDKQKSDDGFLNGRLLIAMPTMTDSRFEKSVVLICHHTPETAMGIVLNKAIEGMSFPELLKQLHIESADGSEPPDLTVHFGGPVQTSRGFVLHSDDYVIDDATLDVAAGIGLTATMDVLKALGSGKGPEHAFFALGYAGWGAGQLEAELLDNAWLIGEPDAALVFGADLDDKWPLALAKLGINPGMISGIGGRA